MTYTGIVLNSTVAKEPSNRKPITNIGKLYASEFDTTEVEEIKPEKIINSKYGIAKLPTKTPKIPK